jgi:aspartate dehydrogenase
VTAPLRVVLVGWGAIGRTVARLLPDADVEVVGVAVRDVARERNDLPAGSVLLSDPSELAALNVDVVAEAAGRDSVEPWGHAALAAGADFIVSSVSALADAELLASLRQAAQTGPGRLQIQTGALGGIDALAGAMLMGVDHVEHRIVKPPRAWQDTPAESLCNLDALDAPTAFFRDTAAATASAFPKNANVAMTTALAGVGPEATTIALVADPTATTNRHEISASGAFGSLEVAIANNPLPDNPKTSAMAALNLARAINTRVAPIVI